MAQEKRSRGFLVITVLLVCTLLITLGLLLCSHTWYDLREASQTAGEIQADLLVHSALLYYQVMEHLLQKTENPRRSSPFLHKGVSILPSPRRGTSS